jgi:hypothetical protein
MLFQCNKDFFHEAIRQKLIFFFIRNKLIRGYKALILLVEVNPHNLGCNFKRWDFVI